MVLNKQERKFKRYVALQKDYNDVLDAERKLPWTEVKPYQDGWFIYIDFRDEVKRRDDYPHLKAALDLVHKRGRTKSPKMVNRLRNVKRLDKLYDLFKVGTVNSQFTWYESLSQCYADEFKGSLPYWDSYGDVPPVLARCRTEAYEKAHPATQKWLYKIEDSTKHWGLKSWYKSLIPDHFFKVKVKPAYVTHEKNIDPALMKKKAELRTAMEEYWRVCGGGSSWDRFARRSGNRNHRAAQRAAIQKVLKGISEDFELKQKIRNYHD